MLQLTIRTVMHGHVATPVQKNLRVNAAGVQQKKLHSDAKLVRSKATLHMLLHKSKDPDPNADDVEK